MAWYAPFRGRTVLVTGASSGIGRATACAFAAAGAHVVLAARRRAELDAVAREAGGTTLVVPTDVTSRDEVAAAIRRAGAEFGRLDVVVNNAGVLLPSLVLDIAAADLERMLQVNVFGMLYVLQESVPIMQAQGDGTIVNVASLASRRGVSPLGGYSATKFALVGLTEALRTELHGGPVHVGLVLPGVIETPMVETITHDQEFADLWPSALNMPPSWVVWAIFAVARFKLVEVSVPPGAATLEKLGALAPGMADRLAQWAKSTSHWLAGALGSSSS